MIKRLLQYKSKHVSGIWRENLYSTKTVLQTMLASGSLHELSMT